jgi:hypothetical protein
LKTEQELMQIAQEGGDAEASEAMKELRERFDKTYIWCEDCDYLVVKHKDCCLRKIEKGEVDDEVIDF